MAKKNKFPVWGIVGIVILVVFLMTAMWAIGAYNSLVTLDENVENAWGGVQTDYQRRADLIPNLVATVQAYSDYEGEVLTDITEARAGINNANTPSELEAAGNELNSALARLLVVVENYPNLKANENYLSLQDELAGTENRIKISRTAYNTAVRNYNVRVRRFPTNVIAGMFGFEQKEYFEAAEGTDEAPDVVFN